jgi:hypothetical protein
VLLRSEHLDELLAMQPTAEIDSAMADLAEALLRGVTETVAAEVPRKLGTIVHKSIPTLIQAVDLYREVEGQLSISSRNFLLHSLRSIILMLQADDDLDKLSQASSVHLYAPDSVCLSQASSVHLYAPSGVLFSCHTSKPAI